jgi:hypothetical protein
VPKFSYFPLAVLLGFALTIDSASAQQLNYIDSAFEFYGIAEFDEPELHNEVTYIRRDGTVGTLKQHSLRDTLLFERVKEAGLAGNWQVLSAKKAGEFSQAQIGQELGDVITIKQRDDGLGVPVS